MRHWHVIGAGLAGLAAATRAAVAGDRVSVYEAAPVAGGRCRTYDDPLLGRRVDNGNHLILSGNGTTSAYLDRIGGSDRFIELAPALFPFVDLRTGDRWVLRPGRGVVPLWFLDRRRRPPGVSLAGIARALGLVFAGPERTAKSATGDGPAYDRFWDPMITAALNTAPEEGAARLMRPVLVDTFARGEPWCRPWLAREGLGDGLIDPALALLRAHAADVHLGTRVEALQLAFTHVEGLAVGGELRRLGPADRVVVATPPWVTAALVPDLTGPAAYSAIVNAHFVVDGAEHAPPTFLGVVGAATQWIFRRPGLVSVTISAADRWIDVPAATLAAQIWPEVCAALDLGDVALPPYRIVKEKRATPKQTPAAAQQRWRVATRWSNLALAGDWIDTGLPATIESAVRSGEAAWRALQAPVVQAPGAAPG